MSGVTAASSAGDSKAMSGAAAGPSAGGRDAMALCPELEYSLSLLEPGGGRAEQQQQERRAGAAPMPMVFMCAGCRRPVGDTSSWVFNDEEGGCILLRSECQPCHPGAPPRSLLASLHPSFSPSRCRCGRQRRRGPGAEGLQAPRRVRMVRAGPG